MKQSILLSLLFISISCFAQKPSPELDAIDTYIQETMKEKNIPAIGLGLIKDGKVIYNKNFGVKRIDANTLVSGDMLFEMASTTKMFVAMAILQLQEQGKLSLQSKVVDFIPYFKIGGAYQDITIEHLLKHTSGLPWALPIKYWETEGTYPNIREDAIRAFADRQMDSAPGERHSYSNLGFILLREIIAQASGQPLDEYMKENILQPCGMMKSTIDIYSLALKDRVIPHKSSGDTLVAVPQRMSGAVTNMQSNINEMLNFLLMNLDEGKFNGKRLLSKESYQMLVTPEMSFKVRDIEEGLNRIGLGYEVGTLYGNTIYGHGGRTRTGFKNYTYIFPEKKAAVVVIGSIWSSGIDDIYFKALDVLLKE